MAMIYERGKGTRYTGVDAVFQGAKKVAKAVVGAPKAYVKAVGKANARKRDFDDNKEIADIERAFGSVENYKKLDPLFRTRKEMR